MRANQCELKASGAVNQELELYEVSGFSWRVPFGGPTCTISGWHFRRGNHGFTEIDRRAHHLSRVAMTEREVTRQ